MDRINGADTIDIGGGRRGFRDENLIAGTPGTEVTALFLNMVQEEILRVITEAGIVPSDGDWTQFWQALQILGLAPDRRRRWLAINSMTQASPPGAPVVGDTYLVPANATGIWAANIGKIAQWSGSSWSYVTPPDGHGISLPDGRVFVRLASTYTELLATDTRSGLVELATSAEVQTGTDTTRAVTPAGLAARTATETRTGVVELATVAEATTGTDTNRAVTPAGLTAAVTAAIANVINGSPAALDTLYELAAALGNDANFAATVTTALAAKVDISRVATEALTGIIELATTAEVQTGTDVSRAVTPAGLSSRTATETRTGLIEIATSAEVAAGADTTRAVSPARLKERTDAVTSSAQAGEWNVAVAGGTASVITATLSPAPAALSDGMVVNLRLASALPGAATLNLNGLGAKSIKTPYLNNPAANDAVANSIVVLVYSASNNAFIVQPSDTPRHVTTMYSAPGTTTWTAPLTGWYWVEVYGGGGASATYAGNIQGEGGGGGGYAGEWLFFTAGQTVSMTVGAAGVFGGANGGTTSFGSFLSATGGITATTGGVPGAGGMGTGGMVNLKGQEGADGNNNGQWAGFGGDAAGPNGGKGALTSNGATWPGGGGGLLSYSGNIIWFGEAAAGGIIITY
ncbi:MAG: DUF2793 domain-containing protein [Agrobacterium sp.]|nr:DUF2793 domain-containing protein [Agrobacterium sp.]